MITLPAIVNHQNAIAVRRDGLKQIKGGEHQVDGSALTDFDSSILAIILEWRRVAPNLVVTKVPAKLSVLARVYGLTELFTFQEVSI